MLGGQKFASDQSVVHQWLGQQPASFFASGIQKFVDRWDKCLNELVKLIRFFLVPVPFVTCEL